MEKKIDLLEAIDLVIKMAEVMVEDDMYTYEEKGRRLKAISIVEMVRKLVARELE